MVKKNLAMFGNRVRSYRKSSRAIVTEMKKIIKNLGSDGSGFDVYYLAETEKVSFLPEDTAGDCFHLAPKGQAKVADAILQGMMKP
jgi:hypothetical protein